MVQNPDGQFRTCCMYEKPLRGNYKNIQEAFDSEENKIIRQKMLSGERLLECNKCDIDEMHNGKHGISYRKTFNDSYGFDFVKAPLFKNLEFSTSNKCNFKCIDCGPRFSNQFGPTIENDLPNIEDLQHLEFLKILGGEPFLDKKNIELLDMLPRKNIKLMLVTNNSIFPNETTLKLLSEFKFININLSIDGIQRIAEFVRYGTKWEKFERNWNKWQEWGRDRKNCHIVPHYVMHSLNAPFFEETLAWSKIKFSWWSWDFLVTPEWLNMSYLPDHLKTYIIDNNDKLKPPLVKFLNSNKHDSKIFRKLLSKTEDAPPQMDNYIDLFYRNL
jgi:hypothetical protein